MLCEVAQAWGGLGLGFFATWVAVTALAFVFIMGMSGSVFYHYYARVTFDKWRRKSNPKYPSPEKVRDEIVMTVKGMLSAALFPTTSFWLASQGRSYAFCGLPPEDVAAPENAVAYLVASWLFTWLASDFLEFFYHYLGHTIPALWSTHKAHHVFFNVSPFAVIADEHLDQMVRSSPLLLFPLVMPVNMDGLFLQYALFFFAYGTFLHYGHEPAAPPTGRDAKGGFIEFISYLPGRLFHPHSPFFNTSFQHYCHHAKSIINKPYHCGFFFKIWDQLFGSTWNGECFCAQCAIAAGKRTEAEFAKVTIPDYSIMTQPSFWLNKEALTGATSTDQNDTLTREEKIAAAVPRQKVDDDDDDNHVAVDRRGSSSSSSSPSASA